MRGAHPARLAAGGGVGGHELDRGCPRVAPNGRPVDLGRVVQSVLPIVRHAHDLDPAGLEDEERAGRILLVEEHLILPVAAESALLREFVQLRFRQCRQERHPTQWRI